MKVASHICLIRVRCGMRDARWEIRDTSNEMRDAGCEIRDAFPASRIP